MIFAQDDFGDLVVPSPLPAETDDCVSPQTADNQILSRRSSSVKSTDSDLSGDDDTAVQDAMEELCRLFAGNADYAGVAHHTPSMEIDDQGSSGPLYGSSLLPAPRRFYRRFWIGISRRMIAAENNRRLIWTQGRLHRQHAFQNQPDCHAMQ